MSKKIHDQMIKHISKETSDFKSAAIETYIREYMLQTGTRIQDLELVETRIGAFTITYHLRPIEESPPKKRGG